MSSDSGDVSEMAELQVSMDNDGTVGGVQFDLLNEPDYITIDSIWTADRTTGFTISTTDVGSGTRILLYSTTNNNIAPGIEPILNVRFSINDDAYGDDVLIYFNEVTVSDSIGGIYWISELDTGMVTVFPGYMEEPHNLIAVSGLDGEVPLNWNPPIGPIPPSVPFTIEILTDNWPGETYWELVHADADTVVASIFAGELLEDTTLYSWDLEIVPDISGYNLYRSSAGDPEYQLIVSVGAGVHEYTDNEVINGATYYYYVTTDYSPEGTESGPSNVVDGTPVEWVELSITNGAALSGQTDTLDISINNEAEISFFYIEITDGPDYIIAETILPTNRTQGWTLDVTEASGVMVVTGWGINNNLIPGSDPVCKVIVRSISMEPSLVDLGFTFANIKDYNDVEMNWTGSNANFEVSVETQSLAMPNAVANPGDVITLPLMISNTQPVTAIEFSLSNTANQVTGVLVDPTEYMDFNDWFFAGNTVGNEYYIAIVDLTLNNPIAPGMGHIADISLYVEPNVPTGNSIEVGIVDMIMADANNHLMYTESINPSIFVGTPMAKFSLDTNLTMSGYTADNITISLDNIVPISVFEMLLIDIPDGLFVTAVNPAGRFADVGGSLLDNSGEDEDGNCFIFGYTIGSAVPVGTGPILEISVQQKDYFGGHLGLFFGDVTARDENTNEVTVSATGYGMFSIALGTIDDIALPNRYTLYQNYPNPFNPVTVLQYDLPELSNVNLTIYDLAGRQVRNLLHEKQAPGLKTIVWDARDDMGNKMGAGVYIYQLKTGNFIASKKMILVK